jgi:hypothetical protein
MLVDTNKNEMSRRKFVASSLGAVFGAGLILGVPQILEGSNAEKKPKRILALVGSPRKRGNTDTLTYELLKSANENGAITEKIYLVDRHIAPCEQCEYCHQEAGNKCRIDNDFNWTMMVLLF